MSEQSANAKMPMKGVFYALLASLLFGITTPLSKMLVSQTEPILLAGLLYGGSGLGLLICTAFVGAASKQTSLRREDCPFLLAAIASGGVAAPIMLMLGIASTPASTASLFLNAECVLTVLIAWFIFKENFDGRIAAGMVAIALGGVVLSMKLGSTITLTPGILLVFGACLGWAVDINFTRKVSNADPLQVACYKGLVSGAINTLLAIMSGAHLPGFGVVAAAMLLGFLGYGISLVLFVLGLRHIGAARTGAYFALAPFVGVTVSVVLLSDPITVQLLIAACLMGFGLWLHLTETHSHIHTHPPVSHEHEHVHDQHHRHAHSPNDPVGEPHVHFHSHELLTHDHPHFPDKDHLHQH